MVLPSFDPPSDIFILCVWSARSFEFIMILAFGIPLRPLELNREVYGPRNSPRTFQGKPAYLPCRDYCKGLCKDAYNAYTFW